MNKDLAKPFILSALEEDIIDFSGLIPKGDHSSNACIDADSESRMKLIFKADGILAGVEVVKWVCELTDPNIKLEEFYKDGDKLAKGTIILTAHGNSRSLLRAERILLNYTQRMSGIATLTSKYVEKISHTNTKVLDTRKTTPNNRLFEKWAVKIGGGVNHRYGLFDMIMLKDNHIDFCGGIEKALDRTWEYQQRNSLNLKVEIETRSVDDIRRVLNHGKAHRIMLDNFTVKEAAEGVKLINKAMESEISGGITLETIKDYAETGVDFISVGALTHSAVSLDISFKAY